MRTIKVGDCVEVSSKEDGFLGSYFEAKVIASKPAKSNFTVEYQTLLSDKDRTKKLREVVPAAEVRPRPPKVGVAGYEVMDVVDAYDGDGWWVGRVTGRLGSDRYLVYFDSSGDELEYLNSQMRIHQDWVDGSWRLSHHRFVG